MQKNKFNLQDFFLNEARKKALEVEVFLIDGKQLKGLVKSFDNFTFLLEDEGHQKLVYKHAISTIVPVGESTKVIQPQTRGHGSDEQSI